MKNYSFEQLPGILMQIEMRLEKIEKVLIQGCPQNLPEDDFIGAKKACGILNFALSTLYTKVCRREVPFYKQGNRLYFSRKELEGWIQEGKKKSLNEISANAEKIARMMEKRNRL
jgi:hypothetical protein